MYNHHLDTFIQVADAGSFGKAAEAAYISTPAIIQQINLLEEHCGFSLFSRSNHGVKLTPAGKSLYEDTLTLIRLSEDALNKAKSWQKPLKILYGLEPPSCINAGFSLNFGLKSVNITRN